MIGAAAEAANLLFAFKIPEKKDDKLTNIKKGKVILVKSTAKLNFYHITNKSRSYQINNKWGKYFTNKTINDKIIINKFKTSSANFALFSFFIFSDT